MEFIMEAIPILIFFFYISKKILKMLDKNTDKMDILEKQINSARQIFEEKVVDNMGDTKTDLNEEEHVNIEELEKADLSKQKAVEEKNKSDYRRKMKRREENKLKSDIVTYGDKNNSKFTLSSDELQKGIILKEILDTPRAKNPYYPIYKK